MKTMQTVTHHLNLCTASKVAMQLIFSQCRYIFDFRVQSNGDGGFIDPSLCAVFAFLLPPCKVADGPVRL